MPFTGVASPGPAHRFCTLFGVQLVVRAAGGSGSVFRSIARVLPARGAAGGHAPPMDANDFSMAGAAAREEMMVLSRHTWRPPRKIHLRAAIQL